MPPLRAQLGRAPAPDHCDPRRHQASFGRRFSSTGTVRVDGGKVTIVRTGGSGGAGSTLAATSTAVVVSHGRNDLGPFSYELIE